MNNIFEPLVPMFFVAVWLKIIADAIIRNKLINRGLVDENVKYLFLNNIRSRYTDIKWGMVLIGIGIAIMTYVFTDITSEAMLGLMFLLAGVAFLISHLFNRDIDPTSPNKNIPS